MCTVETKMNKSELYKLLLVERENDGKRLWVLFGLMNVINGALLAFVFSETPQKESVSLFASLFGLVASIFWCGVSLRMSAWIEWWESKLLEIEQDALGKIEIFRNRSLAVKKGISTKIMSGVYPAVLSFAWLIILASKASQI